MLDDASYRGGGGDGDGHNLPDATMLNKMIDAMYMTFAARGMCLNCSIEMLTCVMFARHNASRQYAMRNKYGYTEEQLEADVDRQLEEMLEMFQEAYDKYEQAQKDGRFGNDTRNHRPI